MKPSLPSFRHTEHQRPDGALRDREEDFRSLFENMLNGFAYCKMHFEQNQPQDFTYLDVNRAFETLTGLKHVVGRRVSEVIPGIRKSDPEIFEAYGRVALTGIPERFETFLNALGMWCSIAVYSPRKEYFVAVFEVITERKRAEEARARLAAIVESSDDAIIGKRLDGTIVSWNRGAERLYGYQAQEVMGRSIALLLPPDLADDLPVILEKIKRGELVEHYETERVRKGGARVFVSLTVSPLRGAAGVVLGASSIARDITGRRETEKTAEGLARQMRSILEAAGEGVYGVDREAVLTFVNPAATRILGYEAEELIGHSAHTAFHHSRPDGTAYPVEDCRLAHSVLRTGIATQHEDWFWRKDGSGFPVQLSAAPMKESGKVVGAVVTFNDITERKRTEQVLAKRSEELERSNTELQQFAYISSHDFQEPLRTMASFAQLLERRYQGKLDANADDFIQFIVDGATRMQGLINDLLAYSRVGSRGKDFVPTDCTTVFDQAVANLQMAITESGAIVTHDPLPTVPCDGAQLLQVFQNLVGNSIKFRDSTAPRVHVGAEQNPSEWVFSVKDNGIGIDQQYANRIFEVFQRLHNSTQYPGTGIGLAIAKKIVERHGGRIWVESQLHQGATFLFTLPARCGV
jgi:PAS domain S-box-containing protein